MVETASRSDFVEGGTSTGAVCQCEFFGVAYGRRVNVEVAQRWCLERLGVEAYQILARTRYDIGR
jgi:hypothetical protein